MIDFSIVVCSHNRPGFLEHALESAVAMPEAREIIVVDDCSDDLSVHKVIERFVKIDHRVCPTFRQRNGGEAAALNTGLEMAGGEWIVPLHDDDMLEPGGFPLLLASAVVDRAEVAWGDAMDIDEHGAPRGLVRGDHPNKSRIWREDYFYFPAMAWRADVVKRIGKFDTALPSNLDWDWKVRCVNECRCAYYPVTVVRYRRHPLNKSTVNAGTVMKACEQKWRAKLRRYAV